MRNSNKDADAHTTGAVASAGRREVALALLADPELRLRVCILEDVLRARQLDARQQAAPNASLPSIAPAPSSAATLPNGASCAKEASAPLPSPVQLQAALADPSFAALFELDPTVSEPDWGMQVLWLNMAQLQRELGLPAPPPPAAAAPPSTPPNARAPPLALGAGTLSPPGEAPGSATATAAATAATATAPEPTLLSAIEATFHNHPTDDDDYIAVAACVCLATRRDPKSLLPPYSLHLTDLTVNLRGLASVDPRLAAVLQRAFLAAGRRPGGSSGGGAPASSALQALAGRIAELLAAPRARPAFRQSESLSRAGERVVSLAVELLLRGAAGSSGGGGGGGPVGGGGGGAAAPRPPLQGLPLEAWLSASGGAAGGAARGLPAGAAGDGLPVFLFEYEAPADLYGREDMAAASAAQQRDQYGSTGFGRASLPASPAAPFGDFGRISRGSPSASVATAASGSPATARSASSGGGAPPAPLHGGRSLQFSPQQQLYQLQQMQMQQQQQQLQQQQHMHQQHLLRLQHAWSDGFRALPPASQLQPAASEPVPLPEAVSNPGYSAASYEAGLAAALPRRNTEPAAAGFGAGGEGHGDTSGLSGLAGALGFGSAAWPQGGRGAAEGGSPPHSYGSGMRFPLFSPHDLGSADSFLQHTLAAAVASESMAALQQQQQAQAQHQAHATIAAAVAAASASMAASPGGPANELHVPQEIADVWANAGGGGSMGAMMGRRGSMSSAAGPGGDGQVFAMSPTQESSYIWERAAARHNDQYSPVRQLGGGQQQHHHPGGGTLDFAASGFGFGFPAGMGAAGGDGGGGGGGFMVGSAPPTGAAAPALPPFLGAGMGGGTPMAYASWQASSPAGPSSAGAGRSAPAEDVSAGGSWLLAHGARAAGSGCGGGGIGGGRPGSAVSASAAAGLGAQRQHGGGGGGDGLRVGRSGSMSEEGEEAASGGAGGLELDPLAMTLEAIMGYDPSAQVDPARRATRSVSASAATSHKGLIAAAAAPKSFASAASAGAPDDSSRSSSLDSADAMAGGGGGSGALTGWSALAARLPQASVQHQMHHSQHGGGGMTLAAAVAAAGMSPGAASAMLAAAAGRLSGGGGQMQHAGMMMQQQGGGGGGGGMMPGSLAATMAAMGAAAAAGSVGQRPGGSSGGMLGSGGGALNGGGGGTGGRGDVFGGKPLHPKLTPRVREEIAALVRSVPGLK
ncbi:hypothetical protein TSOC_013324, partial [Tetrabaena socialis]